MYFGPFDEDYGYVTLEGFAAERPVVTLDRRRRSARVRDGRRDRARRRRRSRRRSPRRSTGSTRDREAAARLGTAGNAFVRGRVPALARRRRAAAGLMGARARAPQRRRRRRVARPSRSSAGPGRSSAGEWCSSGRCRRRPPASPRTSQAVLDGLERIGFFERHRMDVAVADRAEARGPRCPGYRLGVYSARATTCEFHRSSIAFACRPRRVDRAARPRARRLRARLEDGGRPARVRGDARGRDASAANLRSPDVLRNEPLRMPWAGHVLRRARGVIVHSDSAGATSRSSAAHAGVRGAASGGGVRRRHGARRRARPRLARPARGPRGAHADRRAGRPERGEAARTRSRGRDASFPRMPTSRWWAGASRATTSDRAIDAASGSASG